MPGKKTPVKRPRMTAQQRTKIMNAITGRTRFLQKMAGVQYGGRRDVFGSAGYVPHGQETFSDFWGIYDRGDVGGRIVDMPARTTWRTPPEIVEEVDVEETDSADADPDSGTTAFTEAFDELAKRLKLWHYFGRVDRLAGIGRYAVLFIGVRGADDSVLKEPLESLHGPDDVIYLSVYSEENAKITTWDMDPQSPRFGQPLLYQLQLSRDNVAPALRGQNLTVHQSRVIHVAEDLLEDDVYGRPRLKRVMNRLFDLEKVAASTGEAYWQLVAKILQANVDPEADIDDDTLATIDTRLEEMIHDLRRQFTGQGVDLKWLQTETPNVSNVADFYFSLIAGASGIPKRILFGSELGELASTTDQATYLGMINERQEQFAEPSILRAFVDRMIVLKGLPAPQTGEYNVIWPTLFETPESEQATTNLARAQTAAALTPVGGNPMELVEIDDESNVYLIARGPEPPATEDPNAEPIIDPTGSEGNDPNMPTATPPSAAPAAAE